MKTIGTIVLAFLIIFCGLVLFTYGAADDSVTPSMRLSYAPPLYEAMTVEDKDWLSSRRGVLDRWFDQRLEALGREMLDKNKLQSGRAAYEGGKPVGSIGIFFALAIETLVANAVKLIIISILTAIIVTWLKSHILKFLAAVVAVVAFLCLIMWLIAWNVAHGVMRKYRV